MTSLASLLRRAADLESHGDAPGSLAMLERATAAASEPEDLFDILLLRARTEALSLARLEDALTSYTEARRLAQAHHLPCLGEADLGIGMTLFDLGREGEGLEAVRRAERCFKRQGRTYLRGCAGIVLAERALMTGDVDTADRHLEVACDLLESSTDLGMLARALTLRASVQASLGAEGPASGLLRRAARVSQDLPDAESRRDLVAQRREVREVIARGAVGRSSGDVAD